MGVPSSPGWKFGYVPSAGEWSNTFAGKVDYPAPLDQGGTGGQTAEAGNYNLQQRAEVITPAATLKPLTFYSLRTDLTASIVTLPAANKCKAGDWIELVDTGNNAAVNNITAKATGADTILSTSSSVSSLLFQSNGFQAIMVTDGVSTWRAVLILSGSGGGGGGATPVIPRQIDGTSYTLTLEDAGAYLQFTSDDPVVLSVPPNATVSYLLGIVVIIEQYGLGQITVTPDTDVIVNGHNSKRSGGQFAVMQLKNGSGGAYDMWTLLGDATP